MGRIAAILGLLSLVLQFSFIQGVKAESLGMGFSCPTGAAALVTPWTMTNVTTPQASFPTGAAAPVMVQIEKKAPWWKFWQKDTVECKPACPCPVASPCPVRSVPTGGAVGICIPIVPPPVVTPAPLPTRPMAPVREPVRGYW